MLAQDIFSKYHIKGWGIDPRQQMIVEYVDARQFLVAERFDLACKLYYIDCYEKKMGVNYAMELYTEHIRAFTEGTFTEPGNEEKDSIKKYFSTFNKLIEDIKANGLDPKEPVPVGKNGIILDGAHRTAIAIYYGLRLPVVFLDKARVQSYNYNFFIHRGLAVKYLDFIAQQFIQFLPRTYIACVWPTISTSDDVCKVEDILKKDVKIIYKKEVHLNYQGIRQLMIQLYGQQKWAGTFENSFSGIDGKVRPCYKKFAPTIVYLLEGNDVSILEVKAKIRNIFNIGNHSIHITDTKSEAIDASQLLFNENSIHFLNYGNILKYSNIIKQLIDAREQVVADTGSYENWVIESGTVLTAYGLRESSDIDYLSYYDLDIKNAENHYFSDRRYQKYSLNYYIYNPASYFYYFNIKFLTLDSVLFIKKTREISNISKKDKRDIRLIKSLKRKSLALERKEKYTLICRLKYWVISILGYKTCAKIKKIITRK